MLTLRARKAITVGAVVVVAGFLVGWPVSIVLSKQVRLIDSKDGLRPGLGARGAFVNTGSRDVGPDAENPLRRRD